MSAWITSRPFRFRQVSAEIFAQLYTTAPPTQSACNLTLKARMRIQEDQANFVDKEGHAVRTHAHNRTAPDVQRAVPVPPADPAASASMALREDVTPPLARLRSIGPQ